MTNRQLFIKALKLEPFEGRVPHFELVFFLTMEAFKRVCPAQRHYSQWNQMSERERSLHRNDIADLYLEVAKKYNHSAIFLHPNPSDLEETIKLIDIVREKSGDEYFLMLHGDATYSIPDGNNMMDFSYRISDEPDKLRKEADELVEKALKRAEIIRKRTSLDGFALCSDYCLNTGPFLSPSMFSDFVAPYLKKLIKGYRDMGFYSIKHTDGNIMPIIDQLIETEPDALHSIDPQAGVDIKVVKEMTLGKLCIIGNVNCGLLQTGTDEQVRESVLYALNNGMPGGGYIFSTSNCIYTGMPLERYDLMLKIWQEEGIYKKGGEDCEDRLLAGKN